MSSEVGMNTLREAAEAALEALEWYAECSMVVEPAAAAMTALRAALAEPRPIHECYGDCPTNPQTCPNPCNFEGRPRPVQEPVAWLFTNLQSGDYDFCYQEDEHDHDREMWHKQPLYTAPPQRPAEPVQEPVAWIDAPERIWLQVCEDDYCEVSFREHDEVTWCAEQQNPLDVPYVRADLAAPPQRKPLTDEGCDHCNHPLYAAIKCSNCGRVTE